MDQYLKENVPDLRQLLPRHAYASNGIQHLGRARWDSFYSFGFVRNPWARLVSWYSMIRERPAEEGGNKFWQYVRMNATTFEEFLTKCRQPVVETKGKIRYEKSLVRNQLDYFTDERGKIAVNFIGRFEALDRDFARVQQQLGLPVRPLPQVNAGRPKDYQSFYTRRTRALVATRFKRDIDYFGYTFDDV
jgi:hypothetical protein